MMKKLLLVFFTINCFAQAPTIEWQKSFGGSQQDMPNHIQQTNDGGFITVGYTLSNNGDISFNNGGGGDFWVVKTDSNGNLQWQSTYGGNDYDFSFWIEQTNDNGYIIAGYTKSNNGALSTNKGITDYWVVKISNLGVIQWQKTYGGSGIDYAYCIRQTPDGGYILIGETTSNDYDVSQNHGGFDIWVLKLNSTGDIQWNKTYGGSGGDYASMISITNDGGYLISGNTHSNDGDISGYHNERDFWIAKINSIGDIQWQRAIGGSGWDDLKSIKQTNDGGYIVVGNTYSDDGDVINNLGTGWVVKLSESGVIQWQKTIGHPYSVGFNSIIENSTDEYIVAGTIYSEIYGVIPSGNYWIIKINNTGLIIWEKIIGGTGNDNAMDIIKTSDEGYAITGYSNSLDGDITGGHDIYDYWVVKLSPEQLSNQSFEKLNLSIYPNPTKNILNLKFPNDDVIENLIISDLLGKEVLNSNENSKQINVNNLSKGLYIINASSSDKKYQSKFIKQ